MSPKRNVFNIEITQITNFVTYQQYPVGSPRPRHSKSCIQKWLTIVKTKNAKSSTTTTTQGSALVYAKVTSIPPPSFVFLLFCFSPTINLILGLCGPLHIPARFRLNSSKDWFLIFNFLYLLSFTELRKTIFGFSSSLNVHQSVKTFPCNISPVWSFRLNVLILQRSAPTEMV